MGKHALKVVQLLERQDTTAAMADIFSKELHGQPFAQKIFREADFFRQAEAYLQKTQKTGSIEDLLQSARHDGFQHHDAVRQLGLLPVLNMIENGSYKEAQNILTSTGFGKNIGLSAALVERIIASTRWTARFNRKKLLLKNLDTISQVKDKIAHDLHQEAQERYSLEQELKSSPSPFAVYYSSLAQRCLTTPKEIMAKNFFNNPATIEGQLFRYFHRQSEVIHLKKLIHHHEQNSGRESWRGQLSITQEGSYRHLMEARIALAKTLNLQPQHLDLTGFYLKKLLPFVASVVEMPENQAVVQPYFQEQIMLPYHSIGVLMEDRSPLAITPIMKMYEEGSTVEEITLACQQKPLFPGDITDENVHQIISVGRQQQGLRKFHYRSLTDDEKYWITEQYVDGRDIAETTRLFQETQIMDLPPEAIYEAAQEMLGEGITRETAKRPWAELSTGFSADELLVRSYALSDKPIRTMLKEYQESTGLSISNGRLYRTLDKILGDGTRKHNVRKRWDIIYGDKVIGHIRPGGR